MKCLRFVGVALTVVLLWSESAQAVDAIHHNLKVKLDPKNHRVEAVDTITLPRVSDAGHEYFFLLHEDVKIELESDHATLRPAEEFTASMADFNANTPVQGFALTVDSGVEKVTVRYSGEIYHPIAELAEEYASSFRQTPGLIGPEGVLLAHTSAWYPLFPEAAVTFTLEVSAPPNWDAVSQGNRVTHERESSGTRVTWEEMTPQEEIYLIAARFTEYTKRAGVVEAMAFLREPDPALAQRYLDVTAQFIEMYRQLIGPYPYTKFALVENFWETGYGMPSFTLLGPKVIRLPFILYSSYPHEILHNWWGNSVYVDYASGNWSEGLTSYLADHLFKEQRGAAAMHRRSTVQNYTDFVSDGNDFPLTQFTGRHSSVSEAVGYGKTLMLFHMLRLNIGDKAFIKGLHNLYREFKFQQASFSDVARVFSDAAEKDLSRFFEQWVKRVGAPQLQVNKVRRKKIADGWRLQATLKQTQPGPAYELAIPVAVTLMGQEQAYQTTLFMDEKKMDFRLQLPAEPLRIDVDPEFDIFRRLDRAEIPPALSLAFGAEQALLVLPAEAPDALQAAYRELAAAWRQTQATGITVKLDSELDKLPADRAVWVLGWENRFAPHVAKALADTGLKVTADRITIGDEKFLAQQHSVVLTAQHPGNPKSAVVWLATNNAAAVPGLARKLPHYRKYSYLAFTGDKPTNTAKNQWPVQRSPMTVVLPGRKKPQTVIDSAQLTAREPLAQLPPVFSEERMMADVTALTAIEMEGRGLGTAGLDQAADYIANAFREAGLQPGYPSTGSYFQEWTEYVGGLNRDLKLKNVIGFIPGKNPDLARQSVVIGAHYDHLGFGWPDVRKGNQGKLHPGADDNASGLAVMLELARLAASKWQPERTIVFVAFTGEESGRLGSNYYVGNYPRYPAQQSIAMINLDTVGRLGESPITVFGTGSAREWPHIFRGVGFVTGVNTRSVPDDFGSSDQRSFLDAGVPAVQLFGQAHSDFHSPTDTIDKVDDAALVKVATVVKETVEYLAGRSEPMTVTLKHAAPTQQAQAPPPGRRVSMGTVPDFAYSGPGVRINDVVADSPAARAGMQEGDVIVRAADTSVNNLRDFSQVLRQLTPGDTVTVVYRRNDTDQTVDVTVTTR